MGDGAVCAAPIRPDNLKAVKSPCRLLMTLFNGSVAWDFGSREGLVRNLRAASLSMLSVFELREVKSVGILLEHLAQVFHRS